MSKCTRDKIFKQKKSEENILKLLECIKQHKLLSFSIILGVIFIPIIVIHILFSIYPANDWWISKWSAGELLDYFGSIMGAISTIIALIVTIIYTNDSQRKQNILSVRPYLQSEYMPMFNYTDIEKYSSNPLYIVFSSSITSSSAEPYMLNEMKKQDFNKSEFFKKHYLINYTLKNVGADNATNIKWTLNNNPIIPEFALSKDERAEYVIVVNSSILEHNKAILNFKYEFDDVLGLASYRQEETIDIIKDDVGLTSLQDKDNLLSSPKRIIL